MQSYKRNSHDSVWVQQHTNSNGRNVKGHWRSRPKIISVKGYFRELNYIKSHKRRRPAQLVRVPMILAGQPEKVDHTMINILKDVEPLMGY